MHVQNSNNNHTVKWVITIEVVAANQKKKKVAFIECCNR